MFPQNSPRYFARAVDETLAIYTSKRASRPGEGCYLFLMPKRVTVAT